MAKPFQTIPMSYEPLDDKKGTKRKCRKKRKESKGVQEAERSLLCKLKHEAVPRWRLAPLKDTASWNVHLKTLLYEKASLICATFLERYYSDEKFGLALHYIRMVLKTRIVLSKYRSGLSDDGVESYLLGRAGDILFMMVQNASKLSEYNAEYDSVTHLDTELLEEFKKEGFAMQERKEHYPFPSVLENLQDLLSSSNQFYRCALSLVNASVDRDNLYRRLGNIENELGVFYMNQAAGKRESIYSVYSSIYLSIF